MSGGREVLGVAVLDALRGRRVRVSHVRCALCPTRACPSFAEEMARFCALLIFVRERPRTPLSPAVA